ncbi:AraC family transcriptional regulator [Breznakia pachnodae]|uniref:AraC-like DNA-binding protein n=1 Tax=Breznakia pachnodae TaxID=265178 RepID=A0ABU0E8F3_9FIRM|nr:AraC family transcriptional regulator [Breznakia pachnodae]MDQ0363181.1 AraC-like DNA-binding protein [Breznakia pachnodae]
MKYNYFYSKIQREATFLWGGRFISTPEWQHKKRTSNFHEIIIVISGVLHIQIGENKFSAPKNTILLIPKGTLHFGTQSCLEDTSFYWFHFLLPEKWEIIDNKMVDFYLQEYPYNNALLLPLYSEEMDFSRINILANQLLDILKRNESNRFYLDFFLTSFLIEITEEIAFDRKDTDMLHNERKTLSYITEWIKASLEQDLSLEIVAKKFNYSKSYLSRMFSEKMNITLTEYIKQLRIERAKSLLSNLSISIEEVAELCGFNDEKYFMRCFKKEELITPSQYRDAFNKSSINNK